MTEVTVELETTFGTLCIQLHVKEAPKTCRNFVELAKSGYYDGCLFHRVIPGFMCQTGDPLGTGSGGESIYGAPFEDEITARLSHDSKGVVSMANSGRNTNTSQFFFTFRACPHLDGKHTIFGHVTSDTVHVLDDFAVVRCKNRRPVKPVKVFSVRVINDPWISRPLPPRSAIPEKPLIAEPRADRCTVQ